MSWPLVKYVLTASLRDRLVVSMIIMIILGVSLSVFMGSAAVIEKNQFVLVFAGASLRLAGVFGLILFVVSHVRRSFENKDVEFLLSRPIGRIQFLLSFAIAFSILAIITGLAVGGSVLALSPEKFTTGNLLWAMSIIVEFVIMVNAALFFAMVISSTASASMITIGFYILSRLMGQILGIISAKVATLAFGPLGYIMQVVSVFMPRLDLMGQTSWLLYGFEDGISYGFIICQGLIYSVLLVLAGLIDLVRKQF